MDKDTIKGVGIDIEEVVNFQKEINNELFLKKIFSSREIEYCKSKMEPAISFTGKFCAKEALLKATESNIEMDKIEIINNKNGQPEIYIFGKKKDGIHCSISHISKLAIAIVIISH